MESKRAGPPDSGYRPKIYVGDAMQCTEVLLANQPAWPRYLTGIDGFRILFLGREGLSGEIFDSECTIVFVEDRDQFCKIPRQWRFPLRWQGEVLSGASGVAIILYEPRVRRSTRRLGQGKQDRTHREALDWLLGRLTIVVKTTSDRASYWQSQALTFVPRGSPIVTLAGCGAVESKQLEVAA